MDETSDAISRITELLRNAEQAVFFGGAGISTESGIPDFRSSAGLYTTLAGRQRSPEYMLSHTALVEHPQDFFDFYRAHLLHPEARPNRAHRALARLEEAGHLSAVVTQNIDGLHQLAGSTVVHELHGSALRNLCVDCGSRFGLDIVVSTDCVPVCPGCHGMVRPDVVLYEEGLDEFVMDASVQAIQDADVLIVGGTSLNVHPAAGLVRFCAGELVLVNRDETPYDHLAQLVVHDSLGRVLGTVADALLGPEN